MQNIICHLSSLILSNIFWHPVNLNFFFLASKYLSTCSHKYHSQLQFPHGCNLCGSLGSFLIRIENHSCHNHIASPHALSPCALLDFSLWPSSSRICHIGISSLHVSPLYARSIGNCNRSLEIYHWIPHHDDSKELAA